VSAAFDIAHRSDRTAYDSLYVALAVQLGAMLVTADDRLVNALAGTPWAGHVMRLALVP
jgi:predicted nucleic acid-binding protein